MPCWVLSLLGPLPCQGMNLPQLLIRVPMTATKIQMIQIILLLPLVLHMWTWPSKDYSHCIAQNLLKIHHIMQKRVDQKRGWLELWTNRFANVNAAFPWEFFSKLLRPFGCWLNQHKMHYYGVFSMKPELTRRNSGSWQVDLFDKKSWFWCSEMGNDFKSSRIFSKIMPTRLRIKSYSDLALDCFLVAGHHVCKAAWLHLLGIGKQRIRRCKHAFKGVDLRTLNRRGGFLTAYRKHWKWSESH